MNLYALFLRRKRKSSGQTTVHVTNCDLTTRLSSETLHHDNPVVVAADPRGPDSVSGSDWSLDKKDVRFNVYSSRNSRSTSLESVARRHRSEDRSHSYYNRSSSSSNRAASVIDLKRGVGASSERPPLIDQIKRASNSSRDLSNDTTDGSGGKRKRGDGKRWPSEPWLGPALLGAFAAASAASLVKSGHDEMKRLEQVENELWKKSNSEDNESPVNVNVFYSYKIAFRLVIYLV